MLLKLAIFGLGYVLGSKAGRARYEAIVAGARDILTGEEVSTAVGFVRGGWWILSQRGKAAAAGRAYQRPSDES
jgi:hypothetical protein